MLLWFAGLAFAGVAVVFDSPRLDYRLVMLGAVLPVIEWGWGPWVLHTLLASVIMLAAVMAVWRGRRLQQRRFLAIPIGLFCHLVLDGTWIDRELFWWPGFGTAFEGAVPEADRPVLVLVAMELAGAAALVWAGRRYALLDPERRRRFVRSGQLDPVVR